MLFRKKKKSVPQPERRLVWSKTFTQAGSFRGFRSVRLSRYYHETIDKTIDTLKRQKYNLKGRTIRLDHIESLEELNEYKVINVYIDDMLIGSVFDSDDRYYPMLTEYDYDKAYVRIEDSAPDEFFENVVTAKASLFIHYPYAVPGR